MMQCKCLGFRKWLTFLEDHFDELASYVEEKLKLEAKKLEFELAKNNLVQAAIGSAKAEVEKFQ